MNKLFFELIQVALGNRECLSRTPKYAEWEMLYDMALKQSLVGICFAGVQKLQAQKQAPNSWGNEQGELLYLQWMAMAAKIQQKNEVVNRQCVEVQKMLAEAGFKSSILKGQGVGTLYRVYENTSTSSAQAKDENENLSLLRQSGDIDIWVDGGMEKALKWCRERYGKVEFDYINAHVPVFSDKTSTSSAQVDVELHWRAQAMTNLFANRKLQEWLEREDVKTMMLGGSARLGIKDEELIITTPTQEFNAFYILLHCYHHMFESGLGLRQLMDYYFVLRTQISDERLVISDDLLRLLKEFGMMRFATGVMWIMKEVFGMERECMICEPDETEGRFLLDEVMRGGNFGHHDDRIKKVSRDGRWQSVWAQLQHSVRLATHYPANTLWQPIWVVYHFLWKRTYVKKWL